VAGLNIRADAYASARALLAEMSRDRARRGFSPSETATDVFALKEALFAVADARGEAVETVVAVSRDRADDRGAGHRVRRHPDQGHARRRTAPRAAEQRRRGRAPPSHGRGLMDRVPILSLGDVLLVSIQVDLQDESVVALQEDLAERIVDSGASGVVIDISAVEIVDSFIGRMFATIASLSKVLDAETVVVGMRPAVAITLVELGLSLQGVRTALDLERGLAALRRRRAERELRPAEDPDGSDEAVEAVETPAATGD